MVILDSKFIPRTQMTLVLIGKGLVFGGLTFKDRGQLGSRYHFEVQVGQILV